MRAVFSEFETDLRQWRINRGRVRARAQNQFMSRPPLGYTIRRGQLMVDPESRGEVVDIFRRYIAGESMAEIARSLGRSRKTISYILKNRFYVEPNLHGKHEIFLKKRLFEQTQKQLQENGLSATGIMRSQERLKPRFRSFQQRYGTLLPIFHRRTSPMPSELVYMRFENVTPLHFKFYEVEVELSLFYPKTLVRRWGRIGTQRPRSIRMTMEGPEELERQIGLIMRRRELHGYSVVREVRVSGMKGVAA